MKTLCLLIPTYNREKSIEYYLQTQLDAFSKYNIDIIIYDSSDNQRTKECVEVFINQGYKNLFYKQCTNDDNMYGSWKTYYGLQDCAESYRYVWLTGDTTIIQVNCIIERIVRCIKERKDLIHIYQSQDVKYDQEYVECTQIFHRFFWSMTHWCSIIFSAEYIKEMSSIMVRYLKQNNGFFIVVSVFELMAERNIQFCFLNDSLYKVSPYRINSTAHQRKDILNSWAKVYCESIDSLPDIYNKYKCEVKKSINKNIHLFSMSGAIYLRADGNIDLDKVREYEKYIRQVTTTPIWWFYVWALIPLSVAKFVVMFINFEKLMIENMLKFRDKLRNIWRKKHQI